MFTKLSEAATVLGVSDKFLRQLIAQKKIPFYQLSPRTLRVDLDEIRNYMKMAPEGRPTSRDGSEEPARSKSEA